MGGTSLILLSRIGNTATGPTGTVRGAVFSGTTGDRTGWAVSSAGDFNFDGLADIMIGSPGINGNAGMVSLFYGQPASSTSLVGPISLTSIPSTDPFAQFTGSTGNLAGYSLAAVGNITPVSANPANPILIGSPGANPINGISQGFAYLIPGVTGGQLGVFPLVNAASAPLQATVLTATSPGQTVPVFFGASVSGVSPLPGRFTADGDATPDLIVGAPGYAVTTGRNLDGGAFIVSGAKIPLAIPTSSAITTQIGVGQAFGPFTVNATTPNALQIFVFSNATITPPFDPVADINPKTVVVNGVAFPNATITKDPVDENKDGIEDAIITITPRSNLGLANGSQNFTISGTTLSTAPAPNQRWSGTATITVTGASGGGGTTPVAIVAPIGLITPTTFITHFGPDRYTPSPTDLSQFNYKAIPLKVAIQPYLPPAGFRMRLLNFYFPNKYHFQPNRVREGQSHEGVFTLTQHVFDTSRYHGRTSFTFTHKVPVVPIYRQTERYNY